VVHKTRAFFTICSNNYAAYAKVLLQSAKQHHPEADLFLCLVDEKLDQPGLYPQDCTLLLAHELEIPDFDSFAFQYDIMELNTAVKPFVFLKLFRDRYDQVVYLDPDIEIFRPLDSVFAALDDGASFVLTPHLLSPAENEAVPNDIVIMRAGIYNLGFLACSQQVETEGLLSWWARRLRYECISKQEEGIFVDQKFMDLIPGFAAHCKILRDVTCNAAYWNLSQRKLSERAGEWFVDGQPLSFFHFSGVEPGNVEMLSKYTTLFRGKQITAPLRTLLQHYSQRLKDFDHGAVPSGTYAYGKFASGTPINTHVRRMFREHHLPWSGNPFENFEAFLHLPARDVSRNSTAFVITNFMRYLHSQNAWLLNRFNLHVDVDIEAFIQWYLDHGMSLGIDPRLIEPVALRAGRRGRNHDLMSHRPVREGEPDLTLVGYLKMAGGVGEAGRQNLRALLQSGLRVTAHDISLGVVAKRDDASCDQYLAPRVQGRAQIFNINADQIPCVIDHIRPHMRDEAYRIAVPFWELAEFPDAWKPALEMVDEVWAPSRFIQMALVRKLSRPVTYMPIALSFDAPKVYDRSYFKLPDDRFLFFFSFDFLSFQERKNPRAAYSAFRKAFARNQGAGGAGLVLKTLNGNHAAGDLEDLRDTIASDPDVTLIDGTLTRDETLGLINACDCVISLHRSEGLGLLVAEAMAMGKPVIATDYSATTEFVLPSTGYPVNYRLIPVKEGQYPFANGSWADPDRGHASWLMRRIFNDPAAARTKAEAGRHHIATNYGLGRVSKLQKARLAEIGF
jgi:glycosyltransferase involved in cell wall biosynthesis